MSEEQAKSLTTVTQAITPQDFSQSRKDLLKFVASQLKETKTGTNGDYGVIPYTRGNKKTLLKPGAEKLAKLFGLSIAYEKVSEVEDFDKGFVFYKYKCILTHFVTGRFVGEAVRQSNSKEKSYNGESVFECANKVESKAQKRALVAAVVQATNASDIFDADVSEFEDEAPNKKVTAEEDPRRTRLYARLYGTATERGFGDVALHNAAKRLYNAQESLNELTNTQLEEFTEKLITTFEVVGKGQKPKKINGEPVVAPVTKITEEDKEALKDDVEEGEIVNGTDNVSDTDVNLDDIPDDLGGDKKVQVASPIEEKTELEPVRVCPNPLQNPDCVGTLPDDYDKPECSSCRMKQFIKDGKITKGIPATK